MLKWLIEYVKNIVSVVSVLVFHVPNQRFDRLSGRDGQTYDGLRGHTGLVLERVLINSGKVRYSGVAWKARLAPGSSKASLDEGQRVKIVSVTGTTIFVTDLDDEIM